MQLREGLRNVEIRRSSRWGDPDGRRTCRAIRMRGYSLSENTAPMVLTEPPSGASDNETTALGLLPRGDWR